MSAMEALATRLEPYGDVHRATLMARHTTFGIGGPADIFVTVRSAAALGAAVRAAREAAAPVFVLGSGSNILVGDGGIRGVVIDNRARDEAAENRPAYRLGSGTSFAGFARRMCREGLAGLDWAVGIPGTLGGAVVYNAGAYGGCLADVLRRVRIQDEAGYDRWYEAEELVLAYRSSEFTRGSFHERTVLEVEVSLSQGDSRALLAEAAEHDRHRLTAQPRGRNAGSMFKNPPSGAAWQLIEAAGMRGMRRGDAAVSELHCNFFVNTGQARAADVRWLVEEAEKRVAKQSGVQLQREVAFVGEW